jgi:crotonobetainyl-CoA:carnitine CoA-transferase CaiB-like acyl-CoA transferase
MDAFTTNTRRVTHRPALNEIIDEVFSRTPLDALTELLESAGIAFGRVNSVADFAHHPQLRLTDTDTPAGEVRLPADPVRVAGATEKPSPRVPNVGEHSDTIRHEFNSRQGA